MAFVFPRTHLKFLLDFERRNIEKDARGKIHGVELQEPNNLMQYHTRFKKSILHKDAFYKLVTILILLLSMAIMQRNSSSKNYF